MEIRCEWNLLRKAAPVLIMETVVPSRFTNELWGQWFPLGVHMNYGDWFPLGVQMNYGYSGSLYV